MTGILMKFISSVLLFIMMSMAVSAEKIVLIFSVLTCIICAVKFLIVTINEPDSIWEIIKKFLYVFLLILMIISILIESKQIPMACFVITVIDTLVEFVRFFKKIRHF